MALLAASRSLAVAARPAAVARPVLSTPRPLSGARRVVVTRDSAGATTKELASEAVGSALFQIIGGAAPAALAAPVNGLALLAMIYAFAGQSGAHFNPAVTVMLLVRGRIGAGKALAYMAAQVGGCVLGALALKSLLVPGIALSFGPAAGVSTSALVGWEMLMTAALGLAVYGGAVTRSAFNASGAIGIAAAVIAAVMTAGPLTGAVINPARALGPAIVFGLSMSTVMTYVAAQLAGGVLAGVVAGFTHE